MSKEALLPVACWEIPLKTFFSFFPVVQSTDQCFSLISIHGWSVGSCVVPPACTSQGRVGRLVLTMPTTSALHYRQSALEKSHRALLLLQSFNYHNSDQRSAVQPATTLEQTSENTGTERDFFEKHQL